MNSHHVSQGTFLAVGGKGGDSVDAIQEHGKLRTGGGSFVLKSIGPGLFQPPLIFRESHLRVPASVKIRLLSQAALKMGSRKKHECELQCRSTTDSRAREVSYYQHRGAHAFLHRQTEEPSGVSD